MLLPKHLLIWSVLFTVQSSAFAEGANYEAGKSVRDLLSLIHLMSEYKKTSCVGYIDPIGIDNLIKSNSNKIKKIENTISRADYETLRTLASSKEQNLFLQSLSKTYIFDVIQYYKTEAGGISFACGVAYGNLISLQTSAMSGRN